MKYLILLIFICFGFTALSETTSDQAQEYTLSKQRELRQLRLEAEKKKIEALAKQKKQLMLKKKREEMLESNFEGIHQ
tara:strand:- start:476 stop:709 length:234 start_codon:yes stop_codon:yes gene_type:complete